jgi:hypothetical protein
VYTVYACDTHGTMLKNCCKEAVDIGWMEFAEGEEPQN